MKLVRLAFWLGVVIYNLPSPASQSAAPEFTRKSGLGGKGARPVLSAATRRLCQDC